ncbi:hypothetical protein [Halocola ammonii]
MVQENKAGKYLKYAIGEVLLVVIGILIALQVNENNRESHQREEMFTVYASIADELTADMDLLDIYLPEFQWKNEILTRIVKHGVPAKEWSQNDSLFNSFSSFPDFGISQARFQVLKNILPYDDPTRLINNQIADFYQKFNVMVEVRTIEANLSYNRNIAYWEENAEWFAAAIADRNLKPLAANATNDPIFRNKLSWYRIVLLRLEEGLREYRNEAGKLKKTIELHLKTNS